MCFSLIWLRDICIWLIIVGAVFAILRLVIPFVLQQFDLAGGIIAQFINIILWAIIACMVVYIAFALISCLLGMSGGSLMPPLPRGR